MSTEDTQNKVVNSNDNHQSSWLHMGDLAINEKCVPFIPLADWLIAKHCKQWWKNHSNLWEYQRAQFGICASLAYPRDSREWTLRFIAIDLDCNPISLINDPSPELQNLPVLKYDPPPETIINSDNS